MTQQEYIRGWYIEYAHLRDVMDVVQKRSISVPDDAYRQLEDALSQAHDELMANILASTGLTMAELEKIR